MISLFLPVLVAIHSNPAVGEKSADTVSTNFSIFHQIASVFHTATLCKMCDRTRMSICASRLTSIDVKLEICLQVNVIN